jgi:hypothetical protein
MPFELSFVKRLPALERDRYINECCVGGDLVVDRLLPGVRERYTDVQTEQEDWGWFIWFRQQGVRLAIDVFTDDPDEGAFRVHLTSRVRRLFSDRVVDTPELEELRAWVTSMLDGWADGPVRVSPLDERYDERS